MATGRLSDGRVLEPVATATEYTVCAVPTGYPEAWSWSVRVVWQRPGRYAVMWHEHLMYSRWDVEHNLHPRGVHRRRSDEEGDYVDRVYRFTYEEAIRLAKILSLKITVNGTTAAGYVEWYDRKEREGWTTVSPS